MTDHENKESTPTRLTSVDYVKLANGLPPHRIGTLYTLLKLSMYYPIKGICLGKKKFDTWIFDPHYGRWLRTNIIRTADPVAFWITRSSIRTGETITDAKEASPPANFYPVTLIDAPLVYDHVIYRVATDGRRDKDAQLVNGRYETVVRETPAHIIQASAIYDRAAFTYTPYDYVEDLTSATSHLLTSGEVINPMHIRETLMPYIISSQNWCYEIEFLYEKSWEKIISDTSREKLKDMWETANTVYPRIHARFNNPENYYNSPLQDPHNQ